MNCLLCGEKTKIKKLMRSYSQYIVKRTSGVRSSYFLTKRKAILAEGENEIVEGR